MRINKKERDKMGKNKTTQTRLQHIEKKQDEESTRQHKEKWNTTGKNKEN